MKLLVAMMFEGMEFLPLIGICIALVAFVGFGGIAFVVLSNVIRNRPSLVVFLSVVLGAAPVLGVIFWSTHYSAPLRLPSGAKEVRIRCAVPFALGIDDNMRFRIPPEEFRSWVGSLCGRSWQDIVSDSPDVRFTAFVEGRYITAALDVQGRSLKGEAFNPPSRFGSAVWMDTSQARSGYLIGPSRFFYGQIMYDSDRQVAYYHFCD